MNIYPTKKLATFKSALVCSLFVGVSLLFSPTAFAQTRTNSAGDYQVAGSTLHTWQVVDPDPSGLRCRMDKSRRPFSSDSLDVSISGLNFSAWDAATVFRKGDRLEMVFGGRGLIVFNDDQGNPWLPTRSKVGDCLVRANRKYIQPIEAVSVSSFRVNSAGDYAGGISLSQWQVVDPDPSGLRCRMEKSRRPLLVDDNLRNGQINGANFSAWDVATVFQKGDRIEAVPGNRGIIFFNDDQKKPWLGIRLSNDRVVEDCLVRANSKYIKPVLPN